MAFSSCGERGLLYSCSALAPHWVASLCRAQALRCRAFSSWSRGLSSCSSQALEHRLTSCGPRHFFSEACGIFQDQGSNPCLLQWQVDSLPLSHQGAPRVLLSCGWSHCFKKFPSLMDGDGGGKAPGGSMHSILCLPFGG